MWWSFFVFITRKARVANTTCAVVFRNYRLERDTNGVDNIIGASDPEPYAVWGTGRWFVDTINLGFVDDPNTTETDPGTQEVIHARNLYYATNEAAAHIVQDVCQKSADPTICERRDGTWKPKRVTHEGRYFYLIGAEDYWMKRVPAGDRTLGGMQWFRWFQTGVFPEWSSGTLDAFRQRYGSVPPEQQPAVIDSHLRRATQPMFLSDDDVVYGREGAPCTPGSTIDVNARAGCPALPPHDRAVLRSYSAAGG